MHDIIFEYILDRQIIEVKVTMSKKIWSDNLDTFHFHFLRDVSNKNIH